MKKHDSVFGVGRNVFFTGLVSFCMDVSSEMIYPLVPLFLSQMLGVNKSLIGLIEGIAESTASVLKVFSGWISDRAGRRKRLMALGYGISALSRPIIATAGIWQQVLAFRFTDRLGKGIRTAPRDALIAESTEANRLARAFGFHRGMDTMGAVVGPACALLLLGALNSSYRTVFWLSIIPAIIAVIVIFTFIRETPKPARPRTDRPKLTLKQFDWKVKFFVVIATIFALGNSSDVFLVLRAGQVGIPAHLVPAVYLMFNLVYSLSSVPAGIAADRFGRKRILLLGFPLFAVIYVGFALAVRPADIWVFFGLYGIYMALTEGVQKAFLATIVPPGFKATAFGVYSTSVGIAMFPASLVGGWLWDHVSPAATFYYGAGTAVLSGILFTTLAVLIRKAEREGPPAAKSAGQGG